MATDRKAGQLILSQLKMLNESIFLLEETIEPAILEGIDASVESLPKTRLGWRIHLGDR